MYTVEDLIWHVMKVITLSHWCHVSILQLLTSYPSIGRPCQRCIKRSIGHLCYDEPKPSAVAAAARSAVKDKENSRSNSNASNTTIQCFLKLCWMVSSCDELKRKLDGRVKTFKKNTGMLTPTFNLSAPFQMPSVPLAFASEEMGNEFSVIR